MVVDPEKLREICQTLSTKLETLQKSLLDTMNELDILIQKLDSG